jgi:hypothetical protein
VLLLANRTSRLTISLGMANTGDNSPTLQSSAPVALAGKELAQVQLAACLTGKLA